MTNKERIASLSDNYNSISHKLTEFEKAKLEQQIWELTGPEIRKIKARTIWLGEVLNAESSRIYGDRFSLLNAGPICNELWRRVDHENMPVTTALRLYRQAKKLSLHNREPLTKTLESVIAKYDSLPISHIGDGKVVRRRSSRLLPDLEDAEIHPDKPKKQSIKNFQSQIRTQIASHVAAKMKESGADPIVTEKLWRQFEADLNILIDEFNKRLYRVAKQEKDYKSYPVSRTSVVHACQVLMMNPPTPGQLADIKKARKNQRSLARDYHPDTNGGNDSKRNLYDQVMNAYLVLEKYNEDLAKYGVTNEQEGDSNGS